MYTNLPPLHTETMADKVDVRRKMPSHFGCTAMLSSDHAQSLVAFPDKTNLCMNLSRLRFLLLCVLLLPSWYSAIRYHRTHLHVYLPLSQNDSVLNLGS